jgi:hypothetical protein
MILVLIAGTYTPFGLLVLHLAGTSRRDRCDSPRAQVSGCLGPGSSEHDHVLGIDGQVISCSRLDEPGKLHDRTASRVQDDPFDVLDVALDAVAVRGYDD